MYKKIEWLNDFKKKEEKKKNAELNDNIKRFFLIKFQEKRGKDEKKDLKMKRKK